jgi:amino acid adenylation domain-containing protein
MLSDPLHGFSPTETVRLPSSNDEALVASSLLSPGARPISGHISPVVSKLRSIMNSCDEYPLSHGQRALWFLQRMAPENVGHNVAHAVRIRTELDVPLFRRAFQRLVERHPILRTTFATSNDEPVQQVHEHVEVCLRAEDASTWSEAYLDDRMVEEIYRPFDLEQGPLMRVNLFTRSTQDHILLLMLHHIVTDMWSLAMLIYETSLLYQAEKTGVPARVKPFRAQFADHVRWEAEMLAAFEGERLWAYWQEQLAGELPVLNLPTDRPRPSVQTDRGSAQSVQFSAELTQSLKALAQARGATLYMIVLAAFQVLLYRYTGQEDILVGSPKARRRREMARVMGYFVNPVVLRADLAGDPSFLAFLDQVRQTVEVAFEHDAYPFPLLVERLQPGRDPSRPPLFQVMFAWQKTTRLLDNKRMTSFALAKEGRGMEVGGFPLEIVALEQRPMPFDWTLLVGESDKGLAVTLEYNVGLFDAATIGRTLKHFHTLLEGIVAAPEQCISALPLLTEAEQWQLLGAWNDTTADYPQDRCIHQLFEAQVEQTPDAVAVALSVADSESGGQEQLTYRALNERANQLAHRLQKLGVGPEVRVGLFVERSPEMVVGVLGVLKAGGGYVPLDPTYPSGRRGFMLADAGVTVLLTQSWLAGQFPMDGEPGRRVVCLDRDWADIAQESAQNPVGGVTPGNLAYVIYTSGSTGDPKGVLLRHGGLCNLVNAQVRAFDVGPTSRVLQFASFGFDASVSETFMALLSGATLCLAGQSTLSSISALARLLRDQTITAVTLPPSMLSLLPTKDLAALKTVVSAGESCFREIVARWAPGRQFFNAYGPTEATIGPTLYRLEELFEETTSVPIGRPIANTRIYVLDAHLRPAPIGVPGELHVSGVGLAQSYLNRPELTAEKFIPHPFGDESGARLYRTGDLARYLPDGSLEFLGRIDHQVKVRGFRIELGEIEMVLRQHPALQEAVVLAQEDEASGPSPLWPSTVAGTVRRDKRLVAYVAPRQGVEADLGENAGRLIGELRLFLKERLPEYMLPTAFVALAALPLTSSGKVDRSALPAPVGVRPEMETRYVVPRTEVERAIAAVWQAVLGIEKVGLYDNFFDLGGHSLMVVKVHSELQRVFGRALPMVEMFRYTTVSALAEYYSQRSDRRLSFQESHDRARAQRKAVGRQQQRLQKAAHGQIRRAI